MKTSPFEAETRVFTRTLQHFYSAVMALRGVRLIHISADLYPTLNGVYVVVDLQWRYVLHLVYGV